jgi:hypothetical protein
MPNPKHGEAHLIDKSDGNKLQHHDHFNFNNEITPEFLKNLFTQFVQFQKSTDIRRAAKEKIDNSLSIKFWNMLGRNDSLSMNADDPLFDPQQIKMALDAYKKYFRSTAHYIDPIPQPLETKTQFKSSQEQCLISEISQPPQCPLIPEITWLPPSQNLEFKNQAPALPSSNSNSINAVASIVGLVAVGVGIFCLRPKKQQPNKNKTTTTPPEPKLTTPPSQASPTM